jgi:hypothetical protein
MTGLINVSADNLGAVIKILSRWEVSRKDSNKSARSMLTNSFSLYFGVNLEGNTKKCLS